MNHDNHNHNKIYTVGYSSLKSPSDLVRLGKQYEAMVVDTRLVPYSRVPFWRKEELSLALGGTDHYRYLGRTLGNLNYKNGGPIKIADPERGIAELAALLQQSSVILLCTCARVETCHRRVIAEMLAETTGATIEHLEATSIIEVQPDEDGANDGKDGGGKTVAIPALSFTNPWPYFLINGFKLIENRNWPTRYRGPFLIHASKQFDADWKQQPRSNQVVIPRSIEQRIIANRLPLEIFEQMPSQIEDYPAGGIVGTATITDCVTYSSDGWFFGKYGFMLKDARPLPFVPCRGALGLFPVSGEVLAQLELEKNKERTI